MAPGGKKKASAGWRGPLPWRATSSSEAETVRMGRDLATLLRPGDVVALIGPLGAGKTCFTKGILEGLGAAGRVASPTFTLVREHAGPVPVKHIDLYRLEARELDDLDFRDLLYGRSVAVVEWADKAAGRLPPRYYEVGIEPGSLSAPTVREIAVRLAGGPWPAPERPGAVSLHRVPAPPASGAKPAAASTPKHILGIDTSTRGRTLALASGSHVDERFWGAAEDGLPSEDIGASLRSLLVDNGLEPGDIDLLAVTLGPGSFTGVKIGLAAAKALAYGLGRPVIGIPTLDVLAAGLDLRAGAAGADPGAGAAGAGPSAAAADGGPSAAAADGGDAGQHRPVLALIDARRGEVYGAAYRRDEAGQPPVPVALPGGEERFLVGPADSVVRELARALEDDRGLRGSPTRLQGAVIVGDAGAVCPPGLLADILGGPAVFHPEPPSAAVLIELARRRYAQAPDGDDPFALVPIYLRDPGIGGRSEAAGTGGGCG